MSDALARFNAAKVATSRADISHDEIQGSLMMALEDWYGIGLPSEGIASRAEFPVPGGSSVGDGGQGFADVVLLAPDGGVLSVIEVKGPAEKTGMGSAIRQVRRYGELLKCASLWICVPFELPEPVRFLILRSGVGIIRMPAWTRIGFTHPNPAVAHIPLELILTEPTAYSGLLFSETPPWGQLVVKERTE